MDSTIVGQTSPATQLRGVATCRSDASARACARPVATLVCRMPAPRTRSLKPDRKPVPLGLNQQPEGRFEQFADGGQELGCRRAIQGTVVPG